MGWHCKATGGYVSGVPVYKYPDTYGLENIDQIYYILKGFNWTTNAIIGLVTCIGFESEYNPWRWEGNVLPTKTSYLGSAGNKGYGLVQWTPGSYLNTQNFHKNKYIDNPWTITRRGYGPNYADEVGSYWEGYVQTWFLATHAWSIDGTQANADYYDGYHTYYSGLAPTFADYIVSTYPATDLCETWTQNYERAGGSLNPAQRARRQALAAELWNVYNGKPVLKPDMPNNIAWLLFYMKAMNFGKGWI